MSTQEGFFEESKKKVEEYVQDRLLLLKLEAVEKTSRITAIMFTGLLISLFVFLVIFFISFMAAYIIGGLLNHLFWGFGIVAALYTILLVFIIVARKRIIEKRLINIIINILFEKTKIEDIQAPKGETNEQQ